MATGIKIGDDPNEIPNGLLDIDANQQKIGSAGFASTPLLLVFVDMDAFNCGAWAKNLIAIQGSVQIICVVFKNGGTVSTGDITDPTGRTFPIIPNGVWGGSFALTYYNGFLTINDGAFNNSPSNEFFAYLLECKIGATLNHVIADKWHAQGTEILTGDPISFRRLLDSNYCSNISLTGVTYPLTLSLGAAITASGTPVTCTVSIAYNSVAGTYTYSLSGVDARISYVWPTNGAILKQPSRIKFVFNQVVAGTDLASNYQIISGAATVGVNYYGPQRFDGWDAKGMESFVTRRVANFASAVSIQYAIPVSPGIYKNIDTVDLVFSRPVNAANTALIANYRLNGAGWGGRLIQNIKYAYSELISGSKIGQVENVVRVLLDSGSLSTGSADLIINDDAVVANRIKDSKNNELALTTESFTIDTTAPSGYSVSIDQAAINNSNKAAMSFTFAGAEVDSPTRATYNYTVSSSGGGTAVMGSGNITAANQQITGIDVSGLGDGTLTLSVTITDPAGNTGTAATSAVLKDTVAPSGYTVHIDQAIINNSNKTAISFHFASAEVGTVYSWTLTSDHGGTPVTGSGTISLAAQQITGINVSGLGDGTLSLSATLTDTALNTGGAVTANVQKDAAAPIITGVSFSPPSGWLKIGDTLTVTITTSTDPAGGLVDLGSAINAKAASTFVDNHNGTYTVTYIVAEGDTDRSGAACIPISVILQDAAGNSSAPYTTCPAVCPGIDTQAPQNIVLVLDYSGSMDSPVTFGGVSKSKVQWVKDAANDFFNYLLPHVASTDYNVGIALYSTDGLKALDLTSKAALQANPALYTNALALMPTRENTAMGKGLAWALSLLSYATSYFDYRGYRAIVQLADGQQNVQPYINTVENDASHAGMDEYTIDAGMATTGLPTGMGMIDVHSNNRPIPIHTLGIGGNSSWFDTLAHTSEVTNAQHYNDTSSTIWPMTFDTFHTLLPSLFPYASPQIVRKSQEAFNASGPNTFDFALNSSVKRVTVCLSWPGPAPLTCSIAQGRQGVFFNLDTAKDGLYIGTVTFPHQQAVPPFMTIPRFESVRTVEIKGQGPAQIREEPIYEVDGKEYRDVHLPHYITINPTGMWRITVDSVPNKPKPANGSPFLLTVIADEKVIKYKFDPRKIVYWAGEALPLGMKLTRLGVPIDAAASIATQVAKPKTSFANVLAKNPSVVLAVLGAQTSVDPAQVPGLLTTVLANPSVMSQLGQYSSVSTHLGGFLKASRRKTLKSGASLTKTFDPTNVPGSYRLDFNVSMPDPAGGTYQRCITQTAIVLPRPELDYSQLEGKVNGKLLSMIFTPRDRYGNYMGPGFGDDFCVKGLGTIEARVTDKLNGTYLIEAPFNIGHGATLPDFNTLKPKIFELLMAAYFKRGGAL